MKRYIRTNEEIEPTRLTFKVEVVFGLKDTNSNRVAASHEIPNNLPKSKFPHVVKDIPLGIQAKADYDAFIECIEHLITKFYHLHMFYVNDSKDMSNYYSFMAKDDDGQLIIDFKLKIRIANHHSHKSDQSEENKKEEEEAAMKITDGKELKMMYINLICSDENEQVQDYEEAYMWIDEKIEKDIEKMRKNVKYRKKVPAPQPVDFIKHTY